MEEKNLNAAAEETLEAAQTEQENVPEEETSPYAWHHRKQCSLQARGNVPCQ